VYTVVDGDTLFSIARRELGNGERWHEIQDANPALDPLRLPVGQTIVLPPREPAPGGAR
jgi:5'-nucleotidase